MQKRQLNSLIIELVTEIEDMQLLRMREQNFNENGVEAFMLIKF